MLRSSLPPFPPNLFSSRGGNPHEFRHQGGFVRSRQVSSLGFRHDLARDQLGLVTAPLKLRGHRRLDLHSLLLPTGSGYEAPASYSHSLGALRSVVTQTTDQGRALLISRSVGSPAPSRLRASEGKQKQENAGGPGGGPSPTRLARPSVTLDTAFF